MMQAGFFISLSLFFLVVVSPAEAHPGNTASDGCHYCRTNCDKWGVPWNERHCHGGVVLPPLSEPEPTVYIPPTSAPLRISTPIQTKKPIVAPTRVPTKKPTLTITPTATPTITLTPDPIEKTEQTETQEPNFWQRVFNFFFGN